MRRGCCVVASWRRVGAACGRRRRVRDGPEERQTRGRGAWHLVVVICARLLMQLAQAVNLCPGRVAALSSGGASAAWSADALLTDFLHEMMHVLAFSAGLYRFFPSGGAHIAPGPDGGLLVSSPAVLNIARQHFGCPSLQGVPLETQGGSGTAATHWRLRTLNGELMTGTIITGQCVPPYDEYCGPSARAF